MFKAIQLDKAIELVKVDGVRPRLGPGEKSGNWGCTICKRQYRAMPALREEKAECRVLGAREEWRGQLGGWGRLDRAQEEGAFGSLASLRR